MSQPIEDPTLVEIASRIGFEQTLQHIVDAIERAGLKIFAQIDHAAGAAAVGLKMPAATVVLYGRPEGGTPVMLAAPAAALELPLRVLVREVADGQAIVAFHAIAPVLARLGAPEAVWHRLDGAQQVLRDALLDSTADFGSSPPLDAACRAASAAASQSVDARCQDDQCLADGDDADDHHLLKD